MQTLCTSGLTLKEEQTTRMEGGSANSKGRDALAHVGGRELLLPPAQVGQRLARAVMGSEEEEEDEVSSFPSKGRNNGIP